MKQSGEGMNEQTGGFGITVPMVTGSNQPVSLINQQYGLRKAQTFTIQFGINPAPTLSTLVPPAITPTAGPPAPVNCQATLQWVENGNQVQRIITVGNGVSISGMGTGLQVTLQDIPIGADYVNGLAYQVTGLLSPGLRPAFTFLPYLITPLAPSSTTSLAVMAPNTTMTVQIPVNAGVRAVEITAVGNGAGNTADVIAAASSSTVAYKEWVVTGAPTAVGLPSGCIQIVIQNRSTTVAATVSLLWLIDG